MSVLLLRCPDRPGLVASVSGFLLDAGGNIVDADQHADRPHQRFLQRVEFELPDTADVDTFRSDFAALANSLGMEWELFDDAHRARIVILVSHQGHCLYDLLGRAALAELQGDVVEVISNHDDHAVVSERFGVTFTHLPVDPRDRDEQPRRLSAALDAASPDLIVMARYMQILPAEIIGRFRHRIINIHHSFLPAFVGARPYHQAFERGVKVIGATAHYATSELDQGPIISQDVATVSHRDDIERLVARGRDLETIVLARAVQLHLEHRVITYANRTVVFD